MKPYVLISLLPTPDAPRGCRALRTVGPLASGGRTGKRQRWGSLVSFSLACRVFWWRFGVTTNSGGSAGASQPGGTRNVSTERGGLRGWPRVPPDTGPRQRRAPGMGCNSAHVDVSLPLTSGTLGLVHSWLGWSFEEAVEGSRVLLKGTLRIFTVRTSCPLLPRS